MTRKQIVAEILTDLRQYDESQLIDYRSLNMWIKNELKRFGANVTILTEKVLEVENGRAELPDNFWTMYLAVKCTPDSQEINDESCSQQIQESSFWKQRLEKTYIWDNQSGSHKQEDYKTIEEKVYYNNCQVTFRYREPEVLRLTTGIKKEYCATGCKNLQKQLTSSAKNEINIVGNVIQTNFKNGFIYLQYNGLPTDEDGDILIPEVRSLEEYLIYYAKRKILEALWINDDDVNIVNKLQYIRQMERETFSLAMTQVKFENLKNWDKRLKMKMVQESNRFEKMFPSR
jgi:hypothetical protein